VQRLATVAANIILDAPLDALARSVLLTEPLSRGAAPATLTFSGGVAEYMFGREHADFGDIAKPLADELAHELSRRSGRPTHPRDRDRRFAVHAASQRQDHFTLSFRQLSGLLS
jgi:ethanolamine utilization protein EutA